MSNLTSDIITVSDSNGVNDNDNTIIFLLLILLWVGCTYISIYIRQRQLRLHPLIVSDAQTDVYALASQADVDPIDTVSPVPSPSANNELWLAANDAM